MTSKNRMPEVETSRSRPGQEQRIFTFNAIQLILLLFGFGILEATIALRIGFKLTGANPNNPIVILIYGFTHPFLFPFTGLIGSPTAGSMILELSSVFAMLIYALIAWALERTVWLIFYHPRSLMAGTTQTTTSEHHNIS